VGRYGDGRGEGEQEGAERREKGKVKKGGGTRNWKGENMTDVERERDEMKNIEKIIQLMGGHSQVAHNERWEG